MEQSLSWEAKRFSAKQEITHIFMEPESSLPVRILSQINTVHSPHPAS